MVDNHHFSLAKTDSIWGMGREKRGQGKMSRPPSKVTVTGKKAWGSPVHLGGRGPLQINMLSAGHTHENIKNIQPQ